ncbi:MAG: glycosyltransferase family 2 protein [Erysipelotrichaceae bacterium]|nr:glycosyltransferase family 2 protein [Erysipelotrichaceae bacterium]
MGNIEVSVAVITYNMEGYLRQLLDSILKQKTSFKYEIVVDDDCSPDNSRQILQEYKNRYPDIFYLSLRDKNVGGSKNMYGVLKQCRGKYIAILEGDDWWEAEDKLQYQYDFMETHPEYIGMYCNSWCELSRTESIQRVRRNITEPMICSLKDFMSFHFFDRLPNSTDTAFFKNIFNNAEEREIDVFYKAHNMVWDQSLALILYGKGNVYVDPRIVSHHRTIVEKGGTNYQSKYAVEDHKVTDAYMYAQHEEYMENVLKVNCKKFYKVRGMIFAEAYWIAKKNGKTEDKQKYIEIWNQRKKKWPLIYWTIFRGLGTLKRKVTRWKGQKHF